MLSNFANYITHHLHAETFDICGEECRTAVFKKPPLCGAGTRPHDTHLSHEETRAEPYTGITAQPATSLEDAKKKGRCSCPGASEGKGV